MESDGTGHRRRWVVWATAVALAVVVIVGAGLLVRVVLLGETLASGDGWRIEATWGPLGSGVSYHQDAGSMTGGAGGLASPGLLSESISYVPPEEPTTYLVGVLPADAVTVRAGLQLESSTDLRRVGLDVFYVVRIDGVPTEVRLEAVDDDGQVVDTAEPPVPGPQGSSGEQRVESFTGAAHCGWESVEIINVPTDIAPARTEGDAWVSFVRDTEGVLPDRLVFGTFEPDVTMPAGAADIGHETRYGRVWLSEDEPNVAYVAAESGTVERWPPAYPGCD